MLPKEQRACEMLEEALSNGEAQEDALPSVAWANDLTAEELEELWEDYKSS